VRIEVTDLHKTYRDSHGHPVPALCGVNLRVEPGEFAAISGGSACGKSTLLKVLGCLDRPDRGTCLLDGENVANWPENRRASFRNRRIGFVFQSFHLLPFLNVRQNVELPYLYCDEIPPVVAWSPDPVGAWSPDQARWGLVSPVGAWSPDQAPTGVSGLLESEGLGDLEDRYPGELSGGQQQRVAIARALVLGADLLLADEPTGNLDAETTRTILDLFADLARQGKTVLLVTHDPVVAKRANRQLQMAAGKIVHDTATE
jgi:putative ABC transport system ATP-binding protein